MLIRRRRAAQARDHQIEQRKSAPHRFVEIRFGEHMFVRKDKRFYDGHHRFGNSPRIRRTDRRKQCTADRRVAVIPFSNIHTRLKFYQFDRK